MFIEMPRDGRSKSTLVSSEGRKGRRSKNGSREKEPRHNLKEKDVHSSHSDKVPRGPAVVNQPSAKEQPLSLPGCDDKSKNDNGKAKKDSKEKDRKGHSKSSSHKDYQGVDIAKLMKQQAEILQIFKSMPSETSTAVQDSNVPVGLHQVTSIQVQCTHAQTHDQLPADEVTGDRARAAMPAAAVVQEEGRQDPGLVNTLNLAFTVDPNAGSEIDADIAQFVENCLNLPSAIDWEDMKEICDVSKRPKNCPSVGYLRYQVLWEQPCHRQPRIEINIWVMPRRG